ncbi:hypothetical protein M0813_28437 [Anaeramoeba flamelloides]|uniref:MULE transposase domain-containing protein n=1 Tax=Anaeramoeba flamelloides TaxID=1746091 RepID=A0ABQ8XU59_9EUKA|nr:hypothetical protein M0813_28437 [Anaeramoeba flamelloides]
MILLLNNVHCPCGRRKELLDLKKRIWILSCKIETSYLFQKHLEDNRSKMDLKNLTICVDAGWSSRRHANECCFIVIDNKTKLLYDIIVITRDVFSGASGNMEAEAAKYFCEKHKEKINLVGVVKDGDTKLAKIFEAAWNRVNILKDSNHLLKNIRKNIQENANFKCIKNVKLNEIIDVLSDRSEELFQAGSTNRCESFMNSRTKFIEKRFNSSKQWEMRCQFSVLNRELPEWKTILMAQLGLNINLPQIISQAKKNLEKQYEKIRQNTQEYKTGRYTRKLNSYSKEARRIEEGYYIFKKKLAKGNPKIQKYSCRYNCSTYYKTELSRLIHEIIFHKRMPVPLEQDIISKNVLLTKKKLYILRNSLNSSLGKLKDKVKKQNKVKDKLNLNIKNQAFINLEMYIEKFENTFKIKKKIQRTKTLNINEGEFNGDIEIFKEVDDNVDTNEFVEENFDKNDLSDDNEMEEIEEILSSNNIISNDLTDDNILE